MFTASSMKLGPAMKQLLQRRDGSMVKSMRVLTRMEVSILIIVVRKCRDGYII